MRPKTVGGKHVCPEGTILVNRRSHQRAGYTRDDGRTISSSLVKGSVFCTPDKGRKGHGEQVIPIASAKEAGEAGRPKGFLRHHGYGIHKPAGERHRALDRAVDDYGAVPVWRKLHALSNMNSYNPGKSRVFRGDRDYVKETFHPHFGEKKDKKR